MRRRSLLIRTFTSALSASVFTATGWLMGTRTLTMPTEYPPDECPPNYCGGAACNMMCGDFLKTCMTGGCDAGYQRWEWTRAIGCNGGGCECACRYTYPTTACTANLC